MAKARIALARANADRMGELACADHGLAVAKVRVAGCGERRSILTRLNDSRAPGDAGTVIDKKSVLADDREQQLATNANFL